MNDSDPRLTLFKPLSVEFAQDPYPAYARLRESGELVYYPDFDMWLVARYADAQAIVKNRHMVRTLDDGKSEAALLAEKRQSNFDDMPYHARFVQFSLLESEGEIHDRLRKQIFMFFAPAPVARLRVEVQRYVDQLLDNVLPLESFDFVENLAAKLPGHVIGTLMGVPEEDCDMLRVWSERIVQYFDIDRTDEKKKIAEDTTFEFYRYIDELRQIRRRTPADDLITQLINVERAGMISDDEFISTCMLIVMAGHGSTLDVLGSGMHCLLRFPDEMNRLKENPALIKTAVQEMFRFESPLPFFHRFAATDYVHGEQTFKAGTKFGLLYGSANRDSSVIVDADRFDVGRTPNQHLAFGGGAHFCLGNHLARLNMDILFTSLLKRTRSIELIDDSPLYREGLSARGPKSLQVSIRR